MWPAKDKFMDIAKAIAKRTCIIQIWRTPKDFELPDDAEYYAATFLFDHKECEYVEVSEDVANPECEPIILIPLVDGDRQITGCYQIIYRDVKYIGTSIKIWPDDWPDKQFSSPPIRRETLFALQQMEEFRAAYECRFFSEEITSKWRDPQKKRIQPSRYNSTIGDEPLT